MSGPSGQTDQSRGHEHRDGQHLQVQSRDGQQVRRAGAGEGVIDVGVDPLALAQQEGGGAAARSSGRAGRPGETGSSPEPPHRLDERRGSTLGIAIQPVRLVNRQPQVDPLAAEEVAIIEFARVQRPRHPGELPAASIGSPARISPRSPITITIARPETGLQRRPSLIAVRSTTNRVLDRAGSLTSDTKPDPEGFRSLGRTPRASRMTPRTHADRGVSVMDQDRSSRSRSHHQK